MRPGYSPSSELELAKQELEAVLRRLQVLRNVFMESAMQIEEADTIMRCEQFQEGLDEVRMNLREAKMWVSTVQVPKLILDVCGDV